MVFEKKKIDVFILVYISMQKFYPVPDSDPPTEIMNLKNEFMQPKDASARDLVFLAICFLTIDNLQQFLSPFKRMYNPSC